MRREEADDVVVIESQSAGSQSLCVGREIQLSAKNAGFQLHRAVSTVAVALRNFLEIGQKKDIHRRICRQLLFEAEVTRLVAELARLQQFKRFFIPVVNVSAGLQSYDMVDDQVQIIEMTPEGMEKVRGNSAGGAVEDKRKLGLRDGIAHEEPAGTAPRNYFLNRVLRDFRIIG